MLNRRQFLWGSGGLGGIALSHLLSQEAGGRPHPAKAKRVVQLFMSGAASQCDLFDYKPLLDKKAGEPWDPGEKVELFQSKPGVVMNAPWGWKRHGQSGKWISDLLPNLASCVDDIAFVQSMISKSNV